jgi:hypothetical protein
MEVEVTVIHPAASDAEAIMQAGNSASKTVRRNDMASPFSRSRSRNLLVHTWFVEHRMDRSPARALEQSPMKNALLAAAILAVTLAAGGVATRVSAQDSATEMATGNAAATALDPEYRFVQPVCTACHTPQRFLRARPWKQWEDTFSRMQAHGAAGTPAQWDHIHSYFARNLTIIDVNNDLEDELSAALGVSEATAIAIVRGAPFANIAELEQIRGVDKARLEQIAPRLVFGPVRKF